MLGFWRKHSSYQQYVVDELIALAKINPSALLEYENEISKLYILDLDPLKKAVALLYPKIGRPSNYQPEIFHSFILMQSLGFALDNWVEKLERNSVLRIICGFADRMPKTASYYDFINRNNQA